MNQRLGFLFILFIRLEDAYELPTPVPVNTRHITPSASIINIRYAITLC